MRRPFATLVLPIQNFLPITASPVALDRSSTLRIDPHRRLQNSPNPASRPPTPCSAGRSRAFANATVWLIFAALMFALAYEKAGLGRRIALVLVRTMGRRTLTVSYAVAMGAVVLMVIPRLVSWDDILANKQAWNKLVWFATLVALADGLNKVGFVRWFAGAIGARITGVSPTLAVRRSLAHFAPPHPRAAVLSLITEAQRKASAPSSCSPCSRW